MSTSDTACEMIMVHVADPGYDMGDCRREQAIVFNFCRPLAWALGASTKAAIRLRALHSVTSNWARLEAHVLFDRDSDCTTATICVKG